MRKRDHSLLSNAFSLLVCGLLAGLVVAAAAFPAVAMSGLAAKAGADTFDNLPTDIDVLPSPQITYVYAADGVTQLALFFDENRRDVPLTEVAKVMRDAMVAAEDNRFYEHKGVDVKGVARAFVANQSAGGATEQGASTLTMQYVRQVISYSARTPQQVIDATEQTPARKMREIKLAIALEKKLSKDEILERYLNIAYFGNSAYGIFAASQVYFNKTPADLTLAEAGLLAGLPKAPSDFDPTTEKGRPQALERTRNYVLPSMVKMGMIDEAQRAEATAVEPVIVGKTTPRNCTSVQRPELGAGFFCDYLRRWWLEQPAFGVDAYERENRLSSGGYRITTTLDLATQAAAFKHAKSQPGDVPKSQQAALGDSEALLLAAIEPGSGRVQALATNRNFSNDQTNNGPNTNPDKQGLKGNYPNTTVPMITGANDIPGYQAGSVFKIFTAIAALENGLSLDHTINAISPSPTKYIVERSSDAACPNSSFYCPRNASPSMNGVQDMWSAFGKSVNTYFVPLQERVGSTKVVDVAKRLGISFRAKGTKEFPSDYEFANNPDLTKSWGPFTLGVSSTTPLELANAYATLAANGTYCEPIPVLEIRDMEGKKAEAANPRCKNVLNPDVARAAVDIARCPVGDRSAGNNRCQGSGTAPYVRGVVGRPIAGKTGTTDDDRTATMVAMTKNLAVAGFLVNPDWPMQNRVKMAHPPVNNAVAYTLKDGVANKPVIQFEGPSGNLTAGKKVNIPDVKCQSVDQARSKIRGAGFDVDVASAQIPSDCPPGTVARTDPSGSTVRGGVVVIYVSSGAGNAAPGNNQGPGNGNGNGRGNNGNNGRGNNGNNDCPLPWACNRD